jgi:predicted AlkP superfamily phosphohydrolase/phosphomutase
MNNNKILIIGLDGGTFDVIDPMIDKGMMPCLKSMKETGASGKLESVIPPVTAPAWFSLASGKNPGKTGVFGFQVRTKDDFEFEYLSSRFFKGNSFWDLLSEQGKTVGLVNYPMLFPPYPIKGFMVSGLGSSPDQEIAYPANLKEELNTITSGYEIFVNFSDKRYLDCDDLLIKDIHSVFDKNVAAALHLMSNWDWDFFMVVISVTDWIQHALWKYCDSTHPLYDQAKSKRYSPEFDRFWSRVDGAVARLMEQAKPAVTFILSDHGFGPMKKAFYLNNWLQREGYLKRKGFLKRFFGRLEKKDELKKGSRLLKKKLDIKKTTAFCLDQDRLMGYVYINSLHGKSKLKEEIKTKLQNLMDPSGKPVQVTVHKPEDIYWGEYTHLAPDLSIVFDDFEYSVEFRLSDQLFLDHPSNSNRTGSHRMEGVLMVKGSMISKSKIEHTHIYDIASHILYLSGLPIPEDLDGKIIDNLFTPEYLKVHPVVYGKARPFAIDEGFERGDHVEVEKRLKALGYL